MRYMLLLAHAPDAWTEDPPPAGPTWDDGVYHDWVTYTRALHAAGVLVAGQALHPESTATTVRVRDGERVLTDGPYIEAKEHLIGYYLLDTPDLDTALRWAAQAPCAATGTVEVRPLQADTAVELMVGADLAAPLPPTTTAVAPAPTA